MIRQSRFLLLLMVFTTVGLAWPSDVAAQRRPPSGAARTGVAVPRGHAPGYYRPYYYRPYYYRPYYYYPRYGYPYSYYPYYPGFSFGVGFGVGFGWSGSYWGAWGYPYAYPYAYSYPYPYTYPYPYYAYDNTGSARLLITPRNAQVYVDGQFVGLVDEFDGSLQRLHVPIGEHELQVYLEGYRTLTEKVLFTRGTTLRIESALQPLAPGEPPEPKPAPQAATLRTDPYQRHTPAPPHRTGAPAESGTLSLRVNPPDATILIDGEPWERSQGESRFTIDLPEGTHQVEVRKPGYRAYTRSVDIQRGQTLPLNVSLTPGGSEVQVDTRRGAVPVRAVRQAGYR
jgi:PEGA domain